MIFQEPYLLIMQCFALIGVAWLSYGGIIHGHFVSDDFAGIYQNTGVLEKPLTFASVLKWLRYRVGKTLNPKRKEKSQPAWYQSTPAHHRLNIYFSCGTNVLVFLFLEKIVGREVAFLASLLFAVHPLGCQTIAWMSGIGYVLSAFLTLAGLHIASTWSLWGWDHEVALFAFLIVQWLATEAQFAVWASGVILFFLGYWDFAIVSFLASGVGLLGTLREALSLRRKTYVSQQMGYSTNLRLEKFFVVMKTFAYFLFLSFFPKRMGLYHTFHYHYEKEEAERDDRWFWMGFAALGVFVACFFLGPLEARFAATWFLAYLLIFLNWITVHQFVSERYAWFPSLGTCLMAAFLLKDFPPLFWALFGIALMRTWSHLPTFQDELSFYWSNVWNFPNSEVALGNLGVTYSRMGRAGSAKDAWDVGAATNNDYDVNFYNLYSIHRSAFRMEEARGYLVKALSCSTCHFPDLWSRELEDLDAEMAYVKKIKSFTVEKEGLVWAKAFLEEKIKGAASEFRGRWEAHLQASQNRLSEIEKEEAKRRPQDAG